MSLFKKFFVYSMMVITAAWSLGLPSAAKAAGSYPAGSLLALQGQSGAAVYVVNADGTKSVFPDSKTYMTWFSNFDKVVRVPVSELDMYPDKGAVTYRPGTKLVTHANTAKVFAVEPGGVLRWVPSEAVAVSLYGANWATRVQDVIPGYFSSSYSSTGSDLATMYPTGSLVKMGTTTYYIDGTTKRPFANDAALTANNFRTEFVINATSLSGYSDGSSITGAESALTAITGTGSVVIIPSGGLSVSLNAGTPAYNGAALAGSDGVLFSKFNFSATSGDVVVTGMKVKRSSLGSYSDFDRVWVVVDGARRGATKAINSADEASLLFSADSQKVTIANGTTKTFEIWASMSNSAASGDYNVLGVTEITTASTVNGLPVNGYAQAVLTATAPAATISQGSIGDTASIGETGIEVAKFKLANGQLNETLVFKGINLKSTAPTVNTSKTKVANDDFVNFRLLDNSNNVIAGPIAMSADGFVRFNLSTPFTIEAGTSKYEWFTVTADAVAGPDHVIRLAVEEPSDVNAYGGTNMFHSNVTNSYTAEEVVLGNADLVVSTDTASNPVARDVSENSTITLLNAKFTAANGPVSATGMSVRLRGTDMQFATGNEFDNLRVYVNNILVSEETAPFASPCEAASETDCTLVFNDDFSVSGVVPVRVEIDTKDINGTAIIKASIDGTAFTGVTRDSDNVTVSSTGTAEGNYATLVVPGYKVYRSATPVGVTKVLGSQNVDFLGLDIKSNNTTNVTVNKLKVRLVGNGFTAHQNDVQNVKLVDVNGNLISGPKSLNSSKEAEFTGLNLNVNSNGSKVIVRGDMNSSMNDSANVTYDTDDLYFVVVSSEGTANNNTYAGKNSAGTTIDGVVGGGAEINVVSGRIDITVSQTGTLTATLSSDTAVSAQLLAGSTNNAIAQYKLVADKENVQVKKFRVGLTTGPAGEDEIARIALYDGATLLAETNSFSGGYTEFDITSKNFWVMSGTGNAKYLTVKVDLNSTTNTVLDSGATVAAVLIDMETWGSVNEVAPASGATADGFAFAAVDDLDEDLDASETEVTLVDTTGILAGDIIKIGSEQIYVTTVASGTSLDPVVRGFNGTTAAAHTDADLAADTTVAKSIEGNNFKAYGNKLTIANGTLSGGTLSEWGTYTDVFKFKLTPSTSATEEAVLNSVKVSLNTATGISAANGAGWYITAVALYNGAGTQLATSAADIVAASGDVTFSSLAEPIATSGEEFTVKVQVALGSGGGVIESGDKLAMAIESLGSITAAGDIDWDDSVSAAITWIDMGNTTSLVGPTFSY